MEHIVSADFEQITNKIKPMHATNMGPRQNGTFLSADFTKEFTEIGIPYARLHDVEGTYGNNQYVNIHCIFPDFDADENLEDSYNFEPTDRYLKAIHDAGCETFYRLGESIDHYKKQLYVHNPKDHLKWAKICEHIIRHYNEGWADGFHFGIRYWEIWNEPDNWRMWTGTKEEFFNLYRVTSNHLKECFGESIKVGGCAFSGFYAINRENPSEWFKTLVPYMHDFLKYITAEETKSPIDFFSWHCYADTPEELYLHAQYAKDVIDEYGLKNCENILNEFNMYYCFKEYTPYHKGCFADLGASLILSQKSCIDMLMHYGAFPRGTYNNLFALGFDNMEIVRFAGFQSYKDFGTLYRLGNEVKTEGDIEGKLNILAAKNDLEGGIMIVSREFLGELSIDIKGNYTTYELKYTTDGERGKEVVQLVPQTPLEGNSIKINIKENELLYISLQK